MFQSICGAEIIYEEELDEYEKENQIKDLEQAPPKMEDDKPQVHDPMEQVNSALWKSLGLLTSVLFYPLN